MPADHPLVARIEQLFRSTARPLPALSLKEGAAVSAYLNLAHELPPGDERQEILRLSQIVWGRVFQFGKFKRATKSQEILFLKQITSTHLCFVDHRAMLRTVRLFPEPREVKAPRVLASPEMAITGVAKQVRSDLTERICAAYWALRSEKVPRASRTVADTLNRVGIRQGRAAAVNWTSYEVNERVKQAQRHTQPHSRAEYRKWLIQRWDLVVNRPAPTDFNQIEDRMSFRFNEPSCSETYWVLMLNRTSLN